MNVPLARRLYGEPRKHPDLGWIDAPYSAFYHKLYWIDKYLWCYPLADTSLQGPASTSSETLPFISDLWIIGVLIPIIRSVLEALKHCDGWYHVWLGLRPLCFLYGSWVLHTVCRPPRSTLLEPSVISILAAILNTFATLKVEKLSCSVLIFIPPVIRILWLMIQS